MISTHDGDPSEMMAPSNRKLIRYLCEPPDPEFSSTLSMCDMWSLHNKAYGGEDEHVGGSESQTIIISIHTSVTRQGGPD